MLPMAVALSPLKALQYVIYFWFYDIIFAHNLRLLDVTTMHAEAHMQPWAWL